MERLGQLGIARSNGGRDEPLRSLVPGRPDPLARKLAPLKVVTITTRELPSVSWT